jgi:hypothetical protein
MTTITALKLNYGLLSNEEKPLACKVNQIATTFAIIPKLHMIQFIMGHISAAPEIR